ncbi:MAG: hypothetical protein M3380_16085 [Chloroflexota bacterium]|nr:hypothetical protein [Chloroflexota bacterium]
MDQVVLPELYCPFPSTVNQHAEPVHRGTVDWLQRFELVTDEASYRRVYAANFGGLAARFHPTAPREELQLVSDWYTWMFFQDDLRDESEIGRHPDQLAAMDARFLEILKGKDPTDQDGSLAHALCDLRQRLRLKVTATWMRRFIRTVKEYFDATIWEATNRARGITPDVDTYVRVRHLTSGLNIDTQFIDIAEGTRLPPEVRGNAVVSKLTLAANNAVCWANDIFSLEKEVQRGDVHNLVVTLQHGHGLCLQRALDRAAEMHLEETRAFVDIEPHLPSFGRVVDANLERFVSVLRARMRGILDWSHESGHYRQVEMPTASTTIAGTRG